MIKRKVSQIKTYPLIKSKEVGILKLNFASKLAISLSLTFVLTIFIVQKLNATFEQPKSSTPDVLSEQINFESIEPEITDSDVCKEKLIENNLESLFWWNDNYKYNKKIELTKNANFDDTKFITFNFDHKSLVTAGKSNTTGQDLKLLALKDGDFQVVPFTVDNVNSTNTTIKFLPRNALSGTNYYLYFSKLSNESIPNVVVTDENEVNSYSITLADESSYPIKIKVNNDYILKGYTKLEITIDVDESIKSSVSAINYEIPGTDVSSAIISENGEYKSEVDISNLSAGEYSIQGTVYDECYTLKSSAKNFSVSYPLFVVWSMDWEGYDTYDKLLGQIATLSDTYDVPVTQLFNPRIYITSSVPDQRKVQLTNWIKDRQKKGDEVGLHLHMWSDMVRAAGVTPRTTPNWDNMGTGYDVLFSSYTAEESEKILNWAKNEMKKQGFDNLVSFRSGGWAIDEDNFKALEKTGFKVDSSGRTKHNLGPKLIPSNWDLQPDTRPYHPSVENITRSGELNFKVWEFPNNGADSYQYSYNQLKERFDANYQEQMSSPQVVTFLSHPHWFNVDYPKLDELFRYISTKKYENGKGVVVFATLEEVYKYWEDNKVK